MSNAGLLTPEEMAELTGCKQKEGQRMNLEENRIPYSLRADGWPRTTWTVVNAKLLGSGKIATRMTNGSHSPEGFNLEALN